MQSSDRTGSVFTNHSQEYSLSFSPGFAHWNATQLLIGVWFSQSEVVFIQMPLNTEKS